MAAHAFLIFFIVLVDHRPQADLLYWLHARQFETTDDAQVDAHLNPISARIDGTITKVYVEDNQIVKAGDPLVDLDPRDYRWLSTRRLRNLRRRAAW